MTLSTPPEPPKDRAFEAVRSAYLEHVLGPDAARLSESNVGRRDIDENTFGRYDRTRLSLVPWVQRVFDLRGARVLEIGSGTGSSGAAFAEVAGEVLGVEPKPSACRVAQIRARAMGLENLRFMEALSPQIFDALPEVLPAPLDVVLLSAVLEHQTLPERVRTLARAWESLRPGGVLVVAESPNRLTYYDNHTSHLMFFDLLDDELACIVFRQSPREEFVRTMEECLKVSWQNARNMLFRQGRGVCFFDFDAAIPGRPYDVLADGYESEIVDLFGVAYEERLLQSCIAHARLDIPPVFQRQVIFGVFRKPDGPRAPAPKRRFSPFAATADELEMLESLARAGRTAELLAAISSLRAGGVIG